MSKVPKQTHFNCTNEYCRVCMEDHLALRRYFEDETGITRLDHLGIYHSWLSKRGIPPETQHGWGTPQAFDARYISAYIAEFKGEQ